MFVFEINFWNIVGENEIDIKRVFYINMLNMIDVRIENVKWFLVNFIVFYNVYVIGMLIFKYKFLNFVWKYNIFIVLRLLLNDLMYYNL